MQGRVKGYSAHPGNTAGSRPVSHYAGRARGTGAHRVAGRGGLVAGFLASVAVGPWKRPRPRPPGAGGLKLRRAQALPCAALPALRYASRHVAGACRILPCRWQPSGATVTGIPQPFVSGLTGRAAGRHGMRGIRLTAEPQWGVPVRPGLTQDGDKHVMGYRILAPRWPSRLLHRWRTNKWLRDATLSGNYPGAAVAGQNRTAWSSNDPL